ncbi:MAG: hypothetical protein JW807_04610 [Spirochaetes bacterium]|nr:hypothetical protein [Spirochaetota bacterium]
MEIPWYLRYLGLSPFDGACPELVEGLRVTCHAESLDKLGINSVEACAVKIISGLLAMTDDIY